MKILKLTVAWLAIAAAFGFGFALNSGTDWLWGSLGAGSVSVVGEGEPEAGTLQNQPQAGPSPAFYTQSAPFPAGAPKGSKLPGKTFDVDPVVRQNARDSVVVRWVQWKRLPAGSTWGTLTPQQQIDVDNEAWRISPWDRIATN